MQWRIMGTALLRSTAVKFRRVLILSALVASLSWAQSAPLRFDPPDELASRMPEFREGDSPDIDLEGAVSRSLSPFGSRELVVVEESDLTQVPYEDSLARAIVTENGRPIVTVLIRGYRNYSFDWINEDLLHVASSPGRCVTLDRIYDVSIRDVIFGAAYQHCGTQTGPAR